MLRTKLIASVSLLSLLMPIAPVSLARSVDDILAEQKKYLEENYCEDTANRGRCISDVLKRLRLLKEDFVDILNAERDAWIEAHAHMGATDEYRKELQAYMQTIVVKRNTFNAQERESRRIFFDKQKTARARGNSTQSSYSKKISASELEAAKEKCTTYSSTSEIRTCLRHVLKLINPVSESRAIRSR